MFEIPHTFGRIELPNKRSDSSEKSFDCALGRFAEQCLHGMEHQLDGVKIRRILRQVSKTCADSADSLLHTGDLVEGDIVGNHNVSALERRRQTLLYVSQECLAIHGPLNDHRCHDASLTQASDKRYRLPVPHGRVCDQAFAARTPAVQAHHIGGDCRFVDEYEAGGIEPALLTDPASARASHVSALPLCRSQAFFLNVMPWRAKKRDSALRLAETRRLRKTETNSFSVRSGCSRITARICCEYFSNRDVLPPRGIGSDVPSS